MKAVSVVLFRHQNGIYYHIQKTAGKQHWHSLGTPDKLEALRLLIAQPDAKTES